MSKLCLLTAILSFTALRLTAQTADRKTLTLEGAKKLAAAAEAEARTNNLQIAVAVVDDGGNLLFFQRAHEVQSASVELAIAKARCAAAFKRPTRTFQDALAGGRLAILGLPGAMPFLGGLPVTAAAQVAGAIGISGNTTGDQDEHVAQAALAAFSK
jgi:uncharacterized protein GlcG (DUF336 family)